ncbi:MAG: cation transporter, partial [Cognatishimia sp.]|uniref:cation transporter n=1 Tax=Cognatishimia sp. TaxID=2211648 RepID=UPI004058B0A2
MTAACPACIAAPVDMDQTPVAHEAHQSMTLSVPGMKCAACIGTVERALNAMPGVEDARVNLTLKRVSLRGALDAEKVVQALAAVGYDAYPFDLQSGKASDNRVSRDLILRLGVAGFAMMNVMLLSVAVWSGATDATRDLFHLISAT